MKTKLFIVLEGIDGSGTTTQAKLLKEYFSYQNQAVIISPEPSNGPIGHLIREALQGRIFFTKNSDKFDEQMAYLFAADRHDHLYNDLDGVFKLINEGFHVISTRYYFSSLAYNGNTPEQFAFISSLNAKFPQPDLTIYLDIPLEVSLARLEERSLKEVYETKVKLEQVKRNYQTIFANYSGNLLIINGTEDIKVIHQKIIAEINKLLK